MDEELKTRHRSYLEAIFETPGAPGALGTPGTPGTRLDRLMFGGNEEYERKYANDISDIYSHEVWMDWLVKKNVIDPTDNGTQETACGTWFADVVRRSLYRIDDIARRHCKADSELAAKGLEWVHGCCVPPLESIVVEWGENLNMKGIIDRAFPADQYGDFVIESSGRADYEVFAGAYSRTPAFAVFPCYVTASRRRCWEVLQFGKQKQLALVGKRKTFEDLGVDGSAPFCTTQATDAGEPAAIDARKFCELVGKASRQKQAKWWYFGIGHAAFQIALEVVARVDDINGSKNATRLMGRGPGNHRQLRKILSEVGSDVRLKRRLIKVLKTNSSGSQSDIETMPFDEIEEQVMRPARRDALLGELVEKDNQLLVSDMGVKELLDLKESESDSSRSLHWLLFEHECDIPVGLGFSLCSVPFLLREPGQLKELAIGVGQYAQTQYKSFGKYGLHMGEGHYGPLVECVRVPSKGAPPEFLKRVRELKSHVADKVGTIPRVQEFLSLVEELERLKSDVTFTPSIRRKWNGMTQTLNYDPAEQVDPMCELLTEILGATSE